MPKLARGLDTLPQSVIRMVLHLADEEDMLSLGIGEPDFETPQKIEDEMIRAVNQGHTHYTADQGLLQLREAIAQKYASENGFEVDPEKEIMVTNGTSPALLGSILSTVDKGDEVIIPSPAYLAYAPVVRIAGGKPVCIQTKESNEFMPVIEEVAAAISPKTRLMIVSTPNNPTGSVWSEKCLRGISELAQDHDFYILSDEIYERIIYDDTKHVSVASLSGMHEHVITISGLSKSHAMTGFRIGWITGNPEFTEGYRRIHQYAAICAPTCAQYGAVVAIQECDDEVQRMVNEYKRRRDLCMRRIEGLPYVTAIRPKGTFYVFANVSELVSTHFDTMRNFLTSPKGLELQKKLPPRGQEMMTNSKSGSQITMFYLIAACGVIVTAGSAFGDAGEDFMRISYAQNYNVLDAAFDRLEAALENL